MSGTAGVTRPNGGVVTPVTEPPLARDRVAALATVDEERAGVRLEVPGVVGLLTVRADPARVPLADAFGRVLELGLPERLSSTVAGSRRARWMSPDEWLVSCPLESVGELEIGLRSALAAEPGVSITEVSGGWCVLVTSGPAARETLAKAVPIDLDPRVFGRDRVAGTVFAKTGVTLTNLGDGRYELVCRRSFADYVVRFVANAAREHGLALVDPG